MSVLPKFVTETITYLERDVPGELTPTSIDKCHVGYLMVWCTIDFELYDLSLKSPSRDQGPPEYTYIATYYHALL